MIINLIVFFLSYMNENNSSQIPNTNLPYFNIIIYNLLACIPHD